MDREKKTKSFDWSNFIDVLDSSRIGLWSIEIDNNTGINRFYANNTMMELLGAKDYFSPEKLYEFWYSKIHKGYYSYIQKAIEKICSSDTSIEIEYPWKHPSLGDIIVRCSGKFIEIKDGVIVIKGYHQNINDLNQMKVVLSKTEDEIFEWYQDSNTAYVHTNCNQLYKNDVNVENFPQAWVDNGNVREDFKDIYLEAFERINKGSKKSVCELKMKTKDGGYMWFRMTLLKEDIQGDIISNVVVGKLENINNLKEIEIAYVRESKFYNSILKGMLAYGEINLSTDRFLSISGLWYQSINDLEELSISQIMQKEIDNIFYEEERKDYLKIINVESLLEAYKSGTKNIRYKYKRFVQEDYIKTVEVIVNIFEEPYKKDILGVIYLRDLEEKDDNINIKRLSIEDKQENLSNSLYIKKQVDNILKIIKQTKHLACF